MKKWRNQPSRPGGVGRKPAPQKIPSEKELLDANLTDLIGLYYQDAELDQIARGGYHFFEDDDFFRLKSFLSLLELAVEARWVSEPIWDADPWSNMRSLLLQQWSLDDKPGAPPSMLHELSLRASGNKGMLLENVGFDLMTEIMTLEHQYIECLETKAFQNLLISTFSYSLGPGTFEDDEGFFSVLSSPTAFVDCLLADQEDISPRIQQSIRAFVSVLDFFMRLEIICSSLQGAFRSRVLLHYRDSLNDNIFDQLSASVKCFKKWPAEKAGYYTARFIDQWVTHVEHKIAWMLGECYNWHVETEGDVEPQMTAVEEEKLINDEDDERNEFVTA